MRMKWELERNGSVQYFEGAEACAAFVNLLPEGEIFTVRAPDKVTAKDQATLDRYKILSARMWNDR